jgi:uncharacterized protein YndB with AHSA1/START domain
LRINCGENFREKIPVWHGPGSAPRSRVSADFGVPLDRVGVIPAATPMKLTLRILGGLAAFIVALVAIAYLLPRHYRVERSIVINAPAAALFPRVADMREWKNWTVWHERDPEIKNTYSAEQLVVGAWSEWDSKKEGRGKATVTALEPGRRAVYRLEFPDFGSVSTGVFVLTPEGNGTRLVWSDEGDLGYNPINRWFGLWLDGLVGADFEAGLAKLKRTVER